MKKILSYLLILCLLATTALAVDLNTASTKTGAYLLKTVADPQVGSIGGEWAVIGLARSDYHIPQSYWDNYYQTVVDHVQDCKGNLHDKKYTEYSRLVLALTAIGADPTNVGGYNLLAPLGDYDKTIWQGVNGPAWALIALDAGNYAMPQNADAKTQATRQMYVDTILNNQLPDGGWSITSNAAYPSDPDMTGMCLQALANYKAQPAVQTTIQEALVCMSKKQSDNGGFAMWETANMESTTQMAIALSTLDMDMETPSFVKNGSTLLDNILSYQQQNGSFVHVQDGTGESPMSNEQGYLAMVAVQRAVAGKPSIYNMEDVTISVSAGEKPTAGMDKDIQKMPVTTTFSFPDTNSKAVLDLASRSIINGNPDGNFYPDNTMTRAEFATIVVKSLGLTPKSVTQFSDVSTEWFASYVGTAYTKGIIKGTTATTFDPQGTITRQDAAVMVARAAKLCGLKTDYNTQAVRDTLALFMDYPKVAGYAQSSVAFCYDNDILDDSVMNIQPTQAITRGEIAQMLYNLLGLANLR